MTWVDQVRARAADGPAVVDAATAWTTDELLARAAGAAAWLDDLGVPAGAVVPALLHASPETLALVLAGAATGRPVAPLGPRLTHAELSAVLATVDHHVLVADADTRQTATEAAGPGVRVAVLGPFESRGGADLGARPGKVAAVLHTSGTAGLPKRVDIGQAQLAARTPVLEEVLGIGPGDRYVTAKGIHHIGGLGLTLGALAAGAAVIPMPRFTPASSGELAVLSPTHASVVPTMVEDLLPDGGLRLPGLRVLQYGGAPIRPDTLAALLEAHPDLDVVAIYGQTEGSPLAWLSPDDHRRAVADRPELLHAAGRPAPGVELRIGDGEVWARGDHLFRPGRDGWLRTGDLGELRDGYLFLTGRAGDVIVRGGENVHPLEVERVLALHPTVVDVAVAGVPDDRLGEVVGAWVVTDGSPVDVAALRTWARERLAGFKVPGVWVEVDQLPRNPNGKLLRRALPRP